MAKNWRVDSDLFGFSIHHRFFNRNEIWTLKSSTNKRPSK